jgi:aspartyl-tRNA(Asn)/glutamyl-tRNA(Gln) amidotransferase subunit A
MVPIHQRSIPSLGAALRSKALTAVQITGHYLDRIAAHNPVLNCYLFVDAGAARLAAEATDSRNTAGKLLGPLDGMPVAIKNNIDVAGLPTTAGIGARREKIALADAAIVATLRNAGAIILGSLNMHEAALGATTDNAAYGRCHNPHAIGYTPGGSSGGSGSAVASGLCAAALGSDTLGSIRIPASFCGVYGLKPTNGVISNKGTVPMAHQFDCIGPLARSVSDVRALWSIMAPVVAASDIKRIGILQTVNNHSMDNAVRSAYTLATSLMDGLGLSVEGHHLKTIDFAKVLQAALVLAERDAFAFHRDDIARDAEGFTPELRTFLAFGEGLTQTRLDAAHALLQGAAESLHAALLLCDALVMPVTPCVPFPFSTKMPNDIAHFTMLANIAGLPAVTIPCGWSDAGLPVGVQIVGRPNAENALLDLATQLDAVARGYQFPSGFDD